MREENLRQKEEQRKRKEKVIEEMKKSRSVDAESLRKEKERREKEVIQAKERVIKTNKVMRDSVKQETDHFKELKYHEDNNMTVLFF